MEDKKIIGVAQVLQHLKDGMTRDDIAKHYGITKSECKILFKDERLKGKKTIKKPSFVLVEDADNHSAVDLETSEENETEEVEVVDENKTEGVVNETEEEVKSPFGVTTTDEEEGENVAEVNSPAATWD